MGEHRKYLTFVYNLYLFVFQCITKKLQNGAKKNIKNPCRYWKKCVTLHRFNKQRLFYRLKSLEKMKKLVFMFVAMAALSMASCGNKTAQDNAADTTAVDTAAVDTAAVDTAAADTVK